MPFSDAEIRDSMARTILQKTQMAYFAPSKHPTNADVLEDFRRATAHLDTYDDLLDLPAGGDLETGARNGAD